RHYGALQGLDKAATREKYGEEQFMLWRRSFDTPPPEIATDDRYAQTDDPRYAGMEVPRTERLKDVIERLMPYWEAPVRDDRAAGAYHGARHLPSCACEAPRRNQRRGHRRAEHPDGDAAGLRPGGGLHADPARGVPRPGDRCGGGRRGGRSGPLRSPQTPSST